MNRTLRIAALALLAGCTSGGMPEAPVSAGARSPAVARRPAHAVFRIEVPREHRGVRARYISPATQSVTIAMTGPTGTNETVALTPGSPNCSPTLSGTLCTFQIALAPGSYTASVTAYDNTVPASGHALSAATNVGFSIVAGTTNAIHLTLAGVPARLIVTAGSRSSLATPSGSIDLLGVGQRPMIVEALDADGNAIVGPGSPSFTAVQTAGSLALAVDQPVATLPNTFTVAPPAAFSTSTATIAVTARYPNGITNGCSQPNAVCSASVTMQMRELLATVGFDTVTVFEVGQPNPLATVTGGIWDPTAIAFDSVGDLVVANCLVGCSIGSSTDTLSVYAPPFDGVPQTIVDGVSGPRAMALDRSGDLFVANCGSCANLGLGDDVVEYHPPFNASSVPVATISTSVLRPQALAVDASGNLFVAMQNNVVRRYVPPYSAAPSVNVNASDPVALALDGSGDLYVVAQTANAVGVYAPPYFGAKASVANGVHVPVAAGIDGNGNLFVANDAGNTVTEYVPPLTNLSVPATTIANGIAGPNAMTVDAPGNVYVANGNTGHVTSYAAPYSAPPATFNPGSTPEQLVVLP